MTRDMTNAIRVVGGGLLAAGVLAAGAAAGAAAERIMLARGSKPDDKWSMDEFDPVTSEVVTSDGTVLHVEIDENESPLTIVFCHGYALSLDSWYFQRKALQGQARLVFYDQRSHGRSGRADFDSHHVEQLGEDLGDLIAAFAPTGPLVLVGHSMGGMSIMAFAEQQPEVIRERVYGVALIASSAGGLTEVTLGLPAPLGHIFHRIASPAAAALARRRNFVERGRRTSSDLGMLLTRLYSFGSVASEQAGQLVSNMITATPIDVLAEFLPALQDHDKRDALPILQHAEVLVIVGDSDRLTPRSHSEEIVGRIPGAEFAVIKDGGHMVNIEHHEQVDALLQQLLVRVKRDIDGASGSGVA